MNSYKNIFSPRQNLFFSVVLGILFLLGGGWAFSRYAQSVQEVYYRIFEINKTFTWKEVPDLGGGIFRVDAKSGLDAILLSKDRWKDFSLTGVLVNPRDCAVIFDYQSPEHFYFLYFDQNNHSIFWALASAGAIRPLQKIPWPAITAQFPLDLRVGNNRAQLFLSNQLISEVSFESSRGKIGLMLQDASLPKTIFAQMEIQGHLADGRFIKAGKTDPALRKFWGVLFSSVFLLLMMLGLGAWGANIISRLKEIRLPTLNFPIVCLIHLAITGVLFWPFVFKSEVLYSSSDNFGEIFPLFFYSKHLFWQILHGESLGLWNPYVHNGVPFFSNHWNMIYNPLNWPVFLFPDKDVMWALTFKTFLEVFAVGLFAYGFFARALNNKRWALFCAVVYQMCSLLIFCLTIFPAITLYLAMTMYLYFLWSLDSRCLPFDSPAVYLQNARGGVAQGEPPWRKTSWGLNYFWCVFSIVLIFTSANMVFIFYAGLSLGVVTVYRLLSRSRAPESRWLEFRIIAAAWVSAFLISAIRLIPCAVGIMESNRIVQNFYTIHDRFFLWVRLFVPEVVLGFEQNPLTDPNVNLIFRSIDMPSNAQNAFFVYFGVLAGALVLMNLLLRPKGEHRFWKIYALGTLAASLLFQPVWGLLSILCFPLVHYSYHVIILPVGVCMLLGFTGMFLEKHKLRPRLWSQRLVLGVLLIEGLLMVIITYMFPQWTGYSRMLILATMVWFVGYALARRGSFKAERCYLSWSSWVVESVAIISLFAVTALVFIKPIAQKEDLYARVMFPILFLLGVGLLSVRMHGDFFSFQRNFFQRVFKWCLWAGVTAVVIGKVIFSSWFAQCVNLPDGLRNYLVDFAIGELRFVLVLGIGVGVFILFLLKAFSGRVMVGAFIALTVLDLIVFNKHFENVVAPSSFNRAFFSAEALRRDTARDFKGEFDLVDFRANHLDEAGLFANKNLMARVASYTGIIGYMPQRFSDLVKSFGYPPTTVLIYPKDSTDDGRFLDLSAVKYDFVEGGGVRIRDSALSRMGVFYSYRVIEDDQMLLKTLHDSLFDPRQEILLSNGRGIRTAPVRDKSFEMVKIKKATSDIVETQINVGQPAWLLFSESYHPGWKAFIDGKPELVYLANYNFMACQLPPGEHSVRFEFRPGVYDVSRKISVGGMGIFLGSLFLGCLRIRKSKGLK